MTADRRRYIGSGVVINVAIIVLGLAGIAILLLTQGLGGEAGTKRPLELKVELSTVASGLESPVFLSGAGDGSGDRYIVEQRGLIRKLAPDGSIEPAPFLDIRDRVLHHHERGLLGLAFHPQYHENGRFFVLYSRREGDGATSISEFTVGGDGPVEDSERALLVIPSYTARRESSPYRSRKSYCSAWSGSRI